MKLIVLMSACMLATAPAFAQTSAFAPGYTGSPSNIAGVPYYSGIPTQGAPDIGRRNVSAQISQARALIAGGKYADANALLSYPVVSAGGNETRFLKGVASLGAGDAKTARSLFTAVLLNKRQRHPGAMSGLAVAEIRLGNVDAARDILDTLMAQQEDCRAGCGRAASLNQAISVVQKALG